MPATLTAEWSHTDGSDTTFTYAAPLPRSTPPPPASSQDGRRYEVLVVGAGPAGLMLTTLLTRYGLDATSLLCIDARPHQTLVGNADGLNARTLEILGQLGLESSILRHGTPFTESTVWAREEDNPDILVQKVAMPFKMSPARYEQLVTMHQGQVERVFREDVTRYGGNDVQYSSRLVNFKIDEDGDPEFPILVTIEKKGSTEQVRTKYLIGADGARSTVRSLMGVEMEGESTDELWGVIDLIVDSDFPDVRRQSSINTLAQKGNEFSGGVKGGFIIPRERLSNGEYLTRLYLDMTVKDEAENGVVSKMSAADQRQLTQQKRKQINDVLILDRAATLFHPYRFNVKKGTSVQWWAAFPISQRLAKSFTLKDSASHPRVLIVGDACHSHSPRQGQGMNVSMQDSHNLAWKLAYTLLGLDSAGGKHELLDSYEEERLPNARDLVSFDKRMNEEGRTREEKWAELKRFGTSCGIEYDAGFCVDKKTSSVYGSKTWTNDDYLNGVIMPGRRLLNCRVKRFADGTMRDLHDELGGDGRFSILVLASDDFGAADAASSRSMLAVESVCSKIIKLFPPTMVQPIILQPDAEPTFQWATLPVCIKQEAEMRLHYAAPEVYGMYGVEHAGSQAGALVVVRPDGVVGMMTGLGGTDEVTGFLQRIVRTV